MPSTSSVFVISIFTADCDNKFEIASSRVFPIATFVPEATITFFKVVGWFGSFVIVWYIVSTYKTVLFIGIIFISFDILLPVTSIVESSVEIVSSWSIWLSSWIGPSILLSVGYL